MGRQVEWDNIPDGGSALRAGMYELEVDSIEETLTKAKDGVAQRLMYAPIFRVTAPDSSAGTVLRDWYVVGTPDDPEAKKQETWENSIGGERLKRLARTCRVAMVADVDKVLASLVGQKLIASVSEEIDDGTRNPEFKGARRNRIKAIFALGTQPVGPGVQQAKRPAAAPIQGASAPSRAASAPTAPCPYCGDVMPRTQLGVHFAEKHPNE